MKLNPIPQLKDFDYKDKRVFLRVDFNCPIKDGKVTNDNRIREALPTINYLLENGAKVTIGSHLGRPEGKKNLKYTLAPIAERLQELTELEVMFIDDPLSDAPKALNKQLKKNQVLLLENLRFSPDEKAKTGKLSKQVASYTDIYVNDAFGVCHREDASVVSFPRYVPKRAMGLLIEKELKALKEVRDNPERPFGVIMGGAKVSDKIPMIEKLMDKTDVFVIGGAMAYTFLKSQGVPVGESLVQEDLIGFCKNLIQRIEARDKKIILPTDFFIGDSFNSETSTLSQTIPDGKMALDIGPHSVKAFLKELSSCKTILWNGPMGVFENKAFERGTKELCLGLSELKSKKVVGGGDSASAAIKYGGVFDHISTGGGASLQFLEDKPLPGLEALRSDRKEMLEEGREVLETVDPELLKANSVEGRTND